MLPDTVKRQAIAIRDALSRHGWSVTDVEQPFEDEWWSAEIWRIESGWSPQGVRAYLTFLIDPLGGSVVWAVHASRDRPRQRPIDCDPAMRLRNVWQQELPQLVDKLPQLRTDSAEGVG